MNILFITSEAVPFAKTGGLGDVGGILPKVLARSNNVSLFIPGYLTDSIHELQTTMEDAFDVSIGRNVFPASIKKAVISPRFSVFFVSNEHFFAREFLYGDSSGDYADNFTRFLFFQKAALEFVFKKGLHFDIVHCNDWQTALFPLFLKLEPYSSFFRKSKTLFSIHNLGYQGIFPASSFTETQLPEYLFSPEYLEFYGNLNCMKAGIVFSDSLVTVSPTYAKEILSPDMGFGLEGLLNKFSFKLSGILNGVDYNQWNPETDAFIDHGYSVASLEEKTVNKQGLYAELGIIRNIRSPLMILISRISVQKGVELLLNLLPVLLEEDLHFIFLGVGDGFWTEKLKKMAASFPDRMTFLNCFDEKLAHRLEAAADVLFMPSVYEPCGLNQIYSMKYGTVPLVRATGGLEDSVEEFDLNTHKGTGFKFKSNNIAEVMAVIKRVLRIFSNRALWRKIQKNGMAMDFSWEKTVSNYLDLYNNILGEDTHHG